MTHLFQALSSGPSRTLEFSKNNILLDQLKWKAPVPPPLLVLGLQGKETKGLRWADGIWEM